MTMCAPYSEPRQAPRADTHALQWRQIIGGRAMPKELIVRASMGAVSGLTELAPAFTRITGHKLIIRQESRDELEQRLISNAPADLIVQTIGVMDSVIG